MQHRCAAITLATSRGEYAGRKTVGKRYRRYPGAPGRASIVLRDGVGEELRKGHGDLFEARPEGRDDVGPLVVRGQDAVEIAALRNAHGLVPIGFDEEREGFAGCLLYTSPSPRDVEESRMPSSA